MTFAFILIVAILLINSTDSGIACEDDDDHSHSDHHLHRHHHGLRSPPSLIDLNHNANRTYAASEHHRHLEFYNTTFNCGSKSPTSAEMKEASRVVTNWITNERLGLKQVQTVEIDTYFHVITDGFGVNENTPTTEVLKNQMIVLNEMLRPHGFSFRLLGTTLTENEDWYFADLDSQEQTDMKAALRVGDASTLNAYFNGISGGFATFPYWYKRTPSDDGVVVGDFSVPGGLLVGYNEGKILVHEVGHWLGLYHTFQTDFGIFDRINIIRNFLRFRNGCNSDGDGVDDTPASRFPNFECFEGLDSCPRRRGFDPVHNHMEYTDDACRTEFTTGQGERMRAMWNKYRAP